MLRLQRQLGARKAESGDRLVDGAARLGSGVILGDAVASEEEPGGPVVAAARGHR